MTDAGTGTSPPAQAATPHVSAHMIRHYTDALTVGWYDDHDLPPDQVDEYAPLVEDLRRTLQRQGDDDDAAFRTGLQYLLTKPDARLEGFAGGRYAYDADEVRDILAYLYQALYPDVPLPDAPPRVRVDWEVPLDEWWMRRGVTAPVLPGDTLQRVAARHGLTVDVLLSRNPAYARRYRPDQRIHPEDRVVRLRA